jgi:hypothetical protein
MPASIGPETGIRYELTSALHSKPSGEPVRAVFNDPSDVDYVGTLHSITGLDSPEVRENAANLVEADGGLHNRFFYGRRPITMEGQIHAATATERNERLTRLREVSDAMYTDVVLKWQATGGPEVFTSLRRQQPLRISGNWVKDYFAAFVAADPRIYSTAVKAYSLVRKSGIVVPGTATPVENEGTAYTPATMQITGPTSAGDLTDVVVQGYETVGDIVTLNGLTMSTGEIINIDTYNKTVIDTSAGSLYSKVNYVATDWDYIAPGEGEAWWEGTGVTAGANVTLSFRDAWL